MPLWNLTCKFCGVQGKYGDVHMNGWRFAINAPFCYTCPNCFVTEDAEEAERKRNKKQKKKDSNV